MRTLEPIAEQLAEAENALREHRACLAMAKAHRDRLRTELYSQIRGCIETSPEETNVSIAARFGLASETSVRRFRATLGR